MYLSKYSEYSAGDPHNCVLLPAGMQLKHTKSSNTTCDKMQSLK